MTPEEKREAERDRMQKLVSEHVQQLREHFDNVTVFCNTVEPGGEYTCSFTDGSGNWHARKNQVREWLVKGDAMIFWEAKED